MGCIMNRCVKCGVRIIDQTESCPLCCCVVEQCKGKQIQARYPDIRLKERKLDLILRILLFLSIAISVLCIVINVTHHTDIWWSAIVVGGLAYAQLMLFFVVENEHAGYRSKVVLGTACGMAYVVLIDCVFGFTRWSINYAIPAALLAVDGMIIAAMFVNMRNWQSYLMFQILMILCSGVCILLSLIEVITKPEVSYTAFGFSCMMFLATFIIGGRRAINELKRRFHVR